MAKCIIFPNNPGGIAIIYPVVDDLTVQEIAEKDVPTGKTYRIIDASLIPEDRSTRDAWEFDFSNPDAVIIVNPSKITPQKRWVTYAEWRALFTEDELHWAFDNARPAAIRDMIALATAENGVDLNSSGVAGFLDLCITLGSPLTTERKANVIAGEPPVAPRVIG